MLGEKEINYFMDEEFKRVQCVIDHFHLIPERRISYNEDCLTEYVIDRQYGEGKLRFFSDGNSIMILADVLFHENLPAPEIVKDLIYISYYDISNVYLDAGFLETGEKISLKKHTIYTNLALGSGWKSTFQGGQPSRGIIFVHPRRDDILLQSGENQKILSFTRLRKLVRSLNDQENQRELSLIYHQLQDFDAFDFTGLLYNKAKMNEVLAILLSQARKGNGAEGSANRKHLLSESNREEIAVLLDYLNAHPEENLHISELAQMVHMSPSKLKYTFKAATGQNIGEYCRQIRIEKGEELLRTTDWDITRVAEAAGFQSVSHFCSFFKRQSGLTPREFRMLYQQKDPAKIID